MLDPALLRPGRLDMHVSFMQPDESSLQKLFLLVFPGKTNLATLFSNKVASSKPSHAQVVHYLIKYSVHKEGCDDGTEYGKQCGGGSAL